MKKMFFAIFAILLLAMPLVSSARQGDGVESSEQNGYTKYAGHIGPYAITLFLSDVVEENKQCGYYYYNSRPNSLFKLVLKRYDVTNIRGTMKMVIYEYTPKGKHSGTFNGQLEGRGDTYSGTFTNSKGTRYKFSVTQTY